MILYRVMVPSKVFSPTRDQRGALHLNQLFKQKTFAINNRFNIDCLLDLMSKDIPLMQAVSSLKWTS